MIMKYLLVYCNGYFKKINMGLYFPVNSNDAAGASKVSRCINKQIQMKRQDLRSSAI